MLFYSSTAVKNKALTRNAKKKRKKLLQKIVFKYSMPVVTLFLQHDRVAQHITAQFK